MGWGGNLTLSPQVSRFFQTRLRLWGAWEDQTGEEDKKRRKKKDVGCAFEIQILNVLKKETTTETTKKKGKKETEGFTSGED